MTNDPNWADIAAVAILGAELVILAIAAGVGYFQVREARRLREEQARPFVVVDLEAEHAVAFYISITNLGRTLARDVRVTITPELTSSLDTAGDTLASLRILTEPISSLPPGKKLRTILDSAISRKPEDGFPDLYSATVVYWDSERQKRYAETTDLDLSIYWGLTAIARRDVHDVHERLKEIGKTLDSWSAGAPGGGLLRLSPEERRQRIETVLAERRKRQSADPTEGDAKPS